MVVLLLNGAKGITSLISPVDRRSQCSKYAIFSDESEVLLTAWRSGPLWNSLAHSVDDCAWVRSTTKFRHTPAPRETLLLC